jgi:hypothetical protein
MLAVRGTWQIYRDPRDAEMLFEFCCHSVITHMQSTALSYLQGSNPLNVSHLILFHLAVVLYVWCSAHLIQETTCLNLFRKEWCSVFLSAQKCLD